MQSYYNFVSALMNYYICSALMTLNVSRWIG